jgi:hypothetical protein
LTTSHKSLITKSGKFINSKKFLLDEQDGKRDLDRERRVNNATEREHNNILTRRSISTRILPFLLEFQSAPWGSRAEAVGAAHESSTARGIDHGMSERAGERERRDAAGAGE